ncbi:uncharacterized protein LOC119190387 [Manduca sexta]|uniref:uncharacterized protein LOC119190387 n=1 Tax=Manduca sexta TaxID=7130 RepID=UPI00188FE459|nr:uncharacterized protein LOC119190387 [Manduca sexta]
MKRIIINSFPGEFTVRYLFCRYRFNWDALKYSFYNTFYIVTHLVGAFVSISLFSRRFKWDDSVLGLISNFSKIIGSLTTGFARNSTELYIAVAIETFNATSFTALRSISSKLVASDELGKMTSVFNLMEVLTSMVFGPIYSWIYMMTIPIDAGIIYYVSTLLTIPTLMIFGWFFIQHKKNARRPNIEAIDENLEMSNNKNKKEEEEAKPSKEVSLISSIDLADEKILFNKS